MIDAPHIIQTSAQLTAIIPVTVSCDEIQNVMGPSLQELMSTLAAQGMTPAGPWFTHHLRRPTDTFDLEISVPVASPVTPAGRVRPSEWPAMMVARTVYHGPFEGLGDAWSEFMDWLETAGHTRTPDLWERYLTGPESNPDRATWQTELNQPLLSAG